MRWYLYKNETVYGPYVEEQLCAFLKPTDIVAREGTAAWGRASDDPDLGDALSGIIQPAMEWHIVPLHRAPMGPLARVAVELMIKRGELGPLDLIRHQSWQKDVPLGQTKLYQFITTPYVKLEDIPPEDLRAVPRSVVAPGTRAPFSFRDKLAASLPKIHFDFEVTTRVKILAVTALLLPVIGYGVFTLAPTRKKVQISGIEGLQIPSLVVGGRQVKMIVALPAQPVDLDIVAQNPLEQEFRKSVKLEARTPQLMSKEIRIVFDEMKQDDSIVIVKILYRGDLVAKQTFLTTPIEKLERKKPK